YEKCKNDNRIGGVCGAKFNFEGKNVSEELPNGTLISNSIDIRYKHNLKGDLAEVFLTKVLKEFPFPEIENEKFCPEILVWNRIAQKYDLFFFKEPIYFCEYLPDGLTAKIVKIRMKSPI